VAGAGCTVFATKRCWLTVWASLLHHQYLCHIQIDVRPEHDFLLLFAVDFADSSASFIIYWPPVWPVPFLLRLGARRVAAGD
jgi:hypothetical protein